MADRPSATRVLPQLVTSKAYGEFIAEVLKQHAKAEQTRAEAEGTAAFMQAAVAAVKAAGEDLAKYHAEAAS